MEETLLLIISAFIKPICIIFQRKKDLMPVCEIRFASPKFAKDFYNRKRARPTSYLLVVLFFFSV